MLQVVCAQPPASLGLHGKLHWLPPDCRCPSSACLLLSPTTAPQNGWWDASYSAKVNWQAGSFGANGGNVVCADIYGGGALAGERYVQRGWLCCWAVDQQPASWPTHPPTEPPAAAAPPACTVSHAQGGFQGAGALEFWAKTDNGRPQVTINVGGGSVSRVQREGRWRVGQHVAVQGNKVPVLR